MGGSISVVWQKYFKSILTVNIFKAFLQFENYYSYVCRPQTYFVNKHPLKAKCIVLHLVRKVTVILSIAGTRHFMLSKVG